jgi:hypothetical protein
MTAEQLGWLGVWLLVGSSIVILLELALAGLWSARLARSGRALAVVLEKERGVIQSDVARLRSAMEETRILWAPYGRVLRYLQHPLVIALLGHYQRRWFARRT